MPGDVAARRLRTFFVGTETSRNPLLPRLQAIGKQIAEDELCEGPGVLSARYGKRVIITVGGSAIGALKDTDFVEIVDYDAQRHRCLLLGKAEPAADAAAIHWLIYSNREEIGGIVHVHDSLVLEVQEATQLFPETKPAHGPVELAVESLKLLRKSPYFVLRGHGCVAVGKTPDEALGIAMKARGRAIQIIEEAEGMDDGEAPDNGAPPAPPGRGPR